MSIITSNKDVPEKYPAKYLQLELTNFTKVEDVHRVLQGAAVESQVRMHVEEDNGLLRCSFFRAMELQNIGIKEQDVSEMYTAIYDANVCTVASATYGFGEAAIARLGMQKILSRSFDKTVAPDAMRDLLRILTKAHTRALSAADLYRVRTSAESLVEDGETLYALSVRLHCPTVDTIHMRMVLNQMFSGDQNNDEGWDEE